MANMAVDSYLPHRFSQLSDRLAMSYGVLLMGGYASLGVHSLLTVQRLFPGHFRSFLFVSIGVIGSASFVNVEAVEEVRCQSGVSLRRQYWQGVATPWRDAIRGGHRAGVSRGYGSCHHSGRP